MSLQLKAFEILCVFVENAGRLLKKDDLLQQVWSDAVVDENNLNKNVFQLRKVLGERPSGQSYIEIVPRVGYRFVAPVTKLGPAEISQGRTGVGQAVEPLPRQEIRFCVTGDGVRLAWATFEHARAAMLRKGQWYVKLIARPRA